METILLSICLEHRKMIEEILGTLKEKAKKGVKIRGDITYLKAAGGNQLMGPRKLAQS